MKRIIYLKMQKGDWIEIYDGTRGIIQWFGKYTGKEWIKSTRKKGNGFWLVNKNGIKMGYIDRQHCKYISAPLY